MNGFTVYCNVGDTHDFDECPPHFQEVTRLSGMGAVIPETFGAQLNKAKAVTKKKI